MQYHVKNNIQKLRKRNGYTQEELAENIGVTRQTIIAIEKGNYTPSLHLALKLAKIFKTKVEKIFKIVKR